jgi:hypothetical protein
VSFSCPRLKNLKQAGNYGDDTVSRAALALILVRAAHTQPFARNLHLHKITGG